MALFGQSLQSGISFEQPVQQPNAFATIANVATAGLEMFSKSQKQDPKAEKDAAELANFQSWASQIDQADALRSQGRIREAESIEKKANRSFAVAGGNLGDKEVSSYYERVTGRPWELSGSNPQEVTLNKVRASDSYRNAFFATFVQPNLTPEQRDQAALTTVAKNQAAEQAILNQTNTFQLGGVNPDDGFNTQADFMTLISSFREENIGALAAQAQAGQSVRPDQIQAAKARYAQFQSWVTANRPKGVSSDLWKPVQDTLDSLNNEIQIAEELSAKVGDGLRSDAALRLMQSVQEAKRQGLVTDIVADYVTLMPPEQLANLGVVSTSDVVAAGQVLKTLVPNTDNLVVNPSRFKAFEDEAEGKSASENLKQAKVATDTWKKIGGVTPENAERFSQTTLRTAANLGKIGSIDVTPAHSRELTTIFDGTVEAGLNNLDKIDPEKGRFVRGKLVEALDMQLNAAVEGVVGRSRGIFSVNLDTFSFDLDEDALIQRYKGRAGFVGEVPSVVKQAARAYGGDVLLMIEDNAAKVPTNPALAFFLQSSEVSNIRRSAMVMKDYMESARTLSNIKNRIGGIPVQEATREVPIPRTQPAPIPRPRGVEPEPEAPTRGLLGMGGFPDTGTPPGERALRKVGEALPVPSLVSSAEAMTIPNSSDEAISNTIRMEGGYQDQASDYGNWTKPNREGKNLGTNMGITPREYAKWKGVSVDSLTKEDMQNISLAEAEDFYRDRFKKFGIDKYPVEVQHHIFDMTTLHGKWKTIVREAEKKPGGLTNNNLVEARTEYVEGLVKKDPSLGVYLNGWKNRFNKFREEVAPIPRERPEEPSEVSPAVQRLLERTPKDLLVQEEYIRFLIDLAPEREDEIKTALKGIF